MSERTRTNLVRKLGIYVSWAVWLAALAVRFFTQASQVYVLGIFLLGFAPYLLALNVIEPWLAKRDARSPRNGHAG